MKPVNQKYNFTIRWNKDEASIKSLILPAVWEI